MKNYLFLFTICLTCFSIGTIRCKKDADVFIPTGTPSDSIIRTSFIEEFKDISDLTLATGWVIKSAPCDSTGAIAGMWEQGQTGTDKSGNPYGLQAFSYMNSPDEYAYSPTNGNYPFSINNWLITPVLSIKNGDKISFYTCAYIKGSSTDRMQVLMNKSTSTDVGNSLKSAGSFTTVLFDINSTQASGGYPATWQKYNYTFSGISGTINTRIAFRHYVANPAYSPAGIGIDVFKFQVN